MKVFVYGSLKQGFGNSHYLEQYEPLDIDHIVGYDMYSFGAFPAIVKGTGVIQGEVYDVDIYTMKDLDHLEGYPHFYNRTTVKTICEHYCWVYFIENRNMDGYRKVISGCWTKQEKYAIM